MRTLLLTATIATSFVMTAAAQTAPAQPASKPAMAGATLTVVGCVTRQSDTPQTGAGTRGQAAPQYLLTDQAPATPPSAVADGTASSGATPTGGQTPRTIYVLVPHDDQIDFSKHVNHTVRVSGASTAPMTTAPLAGRSAEAAPVGGSTAPAGATGTAFDTSNLPTLTVTALAMVSTSCK